jgi:hypothetical protein
MSALSDPLAFLRPTKEFTMSHSPLQPMQQKIQNTHTLIDKSRGIYAPLRSKAMAALLLLGVSSLLLSGCGSGGFSGGGIVGLSSASVTIDAGQAFQITAQLSSNPTVSWATSGANCSGSACGTIAAGGNGVATYTAPSGLTTQLKVTVTAGIPGTNAPQHTVAITVNPDPVITGTLPAASVGSVYSATLATSGGTGAIKLSLASGTLPDGLTFDPATGAVSGIPTAPITSMLTFQAIDSSDVPYTVTSKQTITVGSPIPLTLVTGALPNGTVGISYIATIGVTGGTSPYTCVVTSGSLPTGLTMSGCAVSGIPTTAGAYPMTVMVTDSSNPTATISGPVSINILPAGSTIMITSPPGATVGVPYTGPIGITGGTGPYTCVLAGATPLPTPLTLSSACVISGTPTSVSNTTVSVTVTDSSQPTVTKTGPVTVIVSAATISLALSAPPAGTVLTPYSGTVGVSGGTAPYHCVISGLPQGLTSANCAISGTPTTAATTVLNVTATDSATPQATFTGPVSLVINPIGPLTLTGSTPNAILNQPYTQTLVTTGGLAPYSYAITGGSLPPGITLSGGAVISGTPTAPGASSFTVTVTDSESPAKTASLPLTLLVVYPTMACDTQLTGPYAFLFQGYDDVLGGILAYQTATVGSFTADGTGVVNAGELDANHQSSNPTGNTISSSPVLGTYTVDCAGRGSLTLSSFDNTGAVVSSPTYAIALRAPVAPATLSPGGSFIEADDNGSTGTRGSGTLLAQTPASFTAGLSGSYAFGLSGDTPCLPTCTIGVIAGPAASVGEFTTNGGQVSGLGDANIASTTYPSEPLTGSYTAADTNGRVQLTLDTANTPSGVYPTDYVVYVVDANNAFLLSTDKHSSYVLLAGSAQQRTQTAFSNASMTGAYVGYENSQTNPGLVGALLQSLLNVSTATIFRGTATADGNCNITNVDNGGLDGLVSTLTSILGSITGLNGILGTYSYTGPITCAVSSSGRATLQYPTPELLGIIPIGTAPSPRVVYLSAPNTGYFLESGYAAIGNIVAQTGGPFTLANLNGSYVEGSTASASLVSINSSGVYVFDGAGNAKSTQDLNVGLGVTNLIELDQTGTETYTATDTTAGRYLLAPTTAIYEIGPNKFAMLVTDPLTTSPSVSLLQK